MQIQRASAGMGTGPRPLPSPSSPPSTPDAAGSPDAFQTAVPERSVARKIFGVSSVTATAGMMAGTSLGAKFGHAGLGFAVGLVAGGAAGFALARFAYSAES